MKISILGAGAMRTPLLLNALVRSDLPLQRVDLFDIDDQRLDRLWPVLKAVRGPVELRRSPDSGQAIRDSQFVLVSLRVGGMAQRARDEQIALRHGILGQETVGPAGFAKGLRTVPVVLDYARQVEALAPEAYLINFSNPVGIVTQAVTTRCPGVRILGICDTPTELFEEAAAVLGVPSRECFFDFFGLNHLGWLRQVYHRGHPCLDRLLGQSERLYRAPFFTAQFLRELNLLPTEYCYFYYHPERAVAGLLEAGRTRGMQLEELNNMLFDELAASPDPLSCYERYLNTRNSTYMQSEAAARPQCNHPAAGLGAELTGYDKIALSVIRSIHFNLGNLIPLNLANRGNLPELQETDVVEVPCVVDSNGAHAVHVGKLPDQVRDLVLQVKEYERLTVAAALSGNPDEAVAALARNPLVATLEQAEVLVREMSA